MRETITAQPTLRQCQVEMSVATADIDNDPIDEKQDSSMKTEKKSLNYKDRLFIHYTHEKRFEPFKRNMHQLYEKGFQHTPALNLKLVVANRNRRNAKDDLIHNRPKRSILRNIAIKNKCLKFLSKSSISLILKCLF